MNATKLIGILLLTALAVGCSKDELIGPKGDKGDKGDTGATGPQGLPGQSNIMDIHTFLVPNNSFNESTENRKVWRYQASTSQIPVVQSSHLVLGFVYRPINGIGQWLAMPYNDFFQSGENGYCQFYFSVGTNGRTWLLLRRSNGSDPVSSNGNPLISGSSTQYKFYVLKKTEVPMGLDIYNESKVADFVLKNPTALAYPEYQREL